MRSSPRYAGGPRPEEQLGGFDAVRLQRHALSLELACPDNRADDARDLAGATGSAAAKAFVALRYQTDGKWAETLDRAVND